MQNLEEKIPNIKDLKSASTPFKPFNIFIVFILVLVIIQSWNNTEMSFSILIDGWGNMLNYISGSKDIVGSGYFPPSVETNDLIKYLKAILQTLEMAVIALVMSVILALPLSFFCSRNLLDIMFPVENIFTKFIKQSLYFLATLLANIFRSINEIVWALIFVSAVGLGPMAGILALGIHTTGTLAKLLSEGNENIDLGPVRALESMGAGFLKTLTYGVLPQVLPLYISMILYRFESDVRSASILGFVGAGGIGFYLFDKIKSFENGSVCTILILIIATVFIVDKLSAFIRKKYI